MRKVKITFISAISLMLIVTGGLTATSVAEPDFTFDASNLPGVNSFVKHYSGDTEVSVGAQVMGDNWFSFTGEGSLEPGSEVVANNAVEDVDDSEYDASEISDERLDVIVDVNIDEYDTEDPEEGSLTFFGYRDIDDSSWKVNRHVVFASASGGEKLGMAFKYDAFEDYERGKAQKLVAITDGGWIVGAADIDEGEQSSTTYGAWLQPASAEAVGATYAQVKLLETTIGTGHHGQGESEPAMNWARFVAGTGSDGAGDLMGNNLDNVTIQEGTGGAVFNSGTITHHTTGVNLLHNVQNISFSEVVTDTGLGGYFTNMNQQDLSE